MMCEQSGPKDLIRDLTMAEEAGFDYSVISDHAFPWLDEQGHAPYAWSVLGAAAQATSRIPLMTYVTCPIKRYHPVVVAQKAATMQLLSDGRFTLGLGAGENLNEHVVGGGWPSVDVRHDMLAEAVQVIRALFDGGYVRYQGRYYEFDSAKVWDLPDQLPPLGVAVSGPASARLAGELADVMIAVEPEAALGEAFDAAGGTGKPRYGQLAVSYDPDNDGPCSGPGISSAGSRAGGRSMPSSPARLPSTPPPAEFGRPTSPSRCPAGPTSSAIWTASGPSPRPASLTWLWSRWAVRTRSRSSSGLPRSSCPGPGHSDPGRIGPTSTPCRRPRVEGAAPGPARASAAQRRRSPIPSDPGDGSVEVAVSSMARMEPSVNR